MNLQMNGDLAVGLFNLKSYFSKAVQKCWDENMFCSGLTKNLQMNIDLVVSLFKHPVLAEAGCTELWLVKNMFLTKFKMSRNIKVKFYFVC